jgi:hypothetical protein
MPEYKLFAQSVGLVGIANAIVSLRGLIWIPILTKTWTQIIVTISLITPIAMLGHPSAMEWFLLLKRIRKRFKKVFILFYLPFRFFGLIFSLLLFALSNSIALTLIKDASATPVIKIALIIEIIGRGISRCC